MACFIFFHLLCVQHPSHSDSSLATGSSEGSLQTTLEEGLSFSVSPPRDLDLPMPLLCPLPSHPLHPQGPDTGDQENHSLKRCSTTFKLQATRGHQRSQSSCGGGSTSPGCPRQDSMDPSDEDMGTGAGGDGCRQTLNSEHLSETLNSLSLTSLLTPSSLASPLVKKCNSTGSLDQTNLSARSKDGRHLYGIDAHGYLSNPWVDGRARGEEDSDITGFNLKSSSRPTDTSSRKNRWNTVTFAFLVLEQNRERLLIQYMSCEPDSEILSSLNRLFSLFPPWIWLLGISHFSKDHNRFWVLTSFLFHRICSRFFKGLNDKGFRF